MQITTISLQNFRNHADTQLRWAPRINVITGSNGAGKTNLLDAIHYLCMTRSFVASSDGYVVQQEAPYFMIKGHFEGKIRSSFDVSCTFSRGEGKKIFVNDSPLNRLSDLVGMVPVVVLAPGDKKLTSGGPKQRRSFIDSLISQISSSYLQDLFDFRKARKQRNTLLKEFRGGRRRLMAALEPWNEQIIEHGSHIVARRAKVLNQFQEYLGKQYEVISGMEHRPHLQYQTFCEPSEDVADIKKNYAAALQEALENELDREVTTVGPHRDEIIFFLNDFELRKYGSQGQHRLFALSLKLAQLFYFSEHLDDSPIFLLDDVFGDLDLQRTEVLLQALIDQAGQTFITSANPLPFTRFISFDNEKNRKFTVQNGNVSTG